MERIERVFTRIFECIQGRKLDTQVSGFSLIQKVACRRYPPVIKIICDWYRLRIDNQASGKSTCDRVDLAHLFPLPEGVVFQVEFVAGGQ